MPNFPIDQGTAEERKEQLLTGVQSYRTIDDAITEVVLDQSKHNTKSWMVTAGIGFIGLNIMMVAIAYLVYQGIGIWGNNQPVGWGFDIINFVWWIGIGHAGTLISAILLLFRQSWRNSINRFAEAMTIFAVMCAGLFPLLHTGRPWVAYWLFPYPNWMSLWPQFRSPLVWDVFAVSTYFTVSALFWVMGLVPDFATLRDRAYSATSRKVFGILAAGWRGSARHWQRYEAAYLILAGLSTPLVLSVHSIVSLDFASSIVPGWNVTIFPPYFVAGAVFAGFAMVIILAVPIRSMYKLEHMITMKHMDWMAKIMLATGLIVCYGYGCEVFYAYYSASPVEIGLIRFRATGPYALYYWSLWFFNLACIQPLWSKKVRYNLKAIVLISVAVSIGMWLERFVIIPMGLVYDHLPAARHYYVPTLWDFAMFGGTLGFFTFLMWNFVRFLPSINMFEMKDLLYKLSHQKHAKAHAADEKEQTHA